MELQSCICGTEWQTAVFASVSVWRAQSSHLGLGMVALAKSCGLIIGFVTFVVRCSPRLYDYSDMLLVARCQSKCFNQDLHPTKHSCLKECEEQAWTKPGVCSSILALDSDPCMKTCDWDSQCPSTEKCCPGACGNICRPADIPPSVTDLPPIPSNITHQEKHRGTSILLHWRGADESRNVFYVLQERHHIGVHYREEKLGDWSPGFVVGKPRLKKKYVFVPGRWYQVRVAAVNLYGTRGFSPPSEPFKLSAQPKPPGAPQNLNFEAVHLVNDKFWIELHWEPPVSELPISKYVIYWSTLATFELNGSPYVKFQETVSPDQTHFSIPDLDRNKRAIMFEVQAMSMFGSKRLKGDKANIDIYTPDYANAETLDVDLSNVSTGKRKRRFGKKKSLPEFKVERIFSQNEELFARMSWGGVGVNVTDHYTVAWSSNQCGNVSRSVFTASTDSNWYTIHGLNYNCTYRATVKTHHHRILFSSSITFTTPLS